MITKRPADERGSTKIDWLDAKHSFSFGDYHDTDFMNFGHLVVMNEDRIAANGGFPTHPHRNMEILTIVLEGSLAHKDNQGNSGTASQNTIQFMRAGKGIAHSEFNPSKTDETHLYQIWVKPDTTNLDASYSQLTFDPQKQGSTLIASPKPDENCLNIQQDCLITHHNNINETFTLSKSRLYWVQVLTGEITINSESYKSGDGAAIHDESTITCEGSGRFLLFDMSS